MYLYIVCLNDRPVYSVIVKAIALMTVNTMTINDWYLSMILK